MGGFRHFGKAGESLVLADGVDQRSAAREHFMDVGLVGYVKDDFVPRRFKDAVKGNGQLHHAQVGAQMAPRDGKGVDEGIPDFFRKAGEFRLGNLHQVRMAADAFQQFREFR